MVVTTRSGKARIAGFPDVPHDDEQVTHRERTIPTVSTEDLTTQHPPSPVPRKIRSRTSRETQIEPGDVPPTYTIDLSLPPSQRYVQLAAEYKGSVEELTYLFDDILNEITLSKKLVTTIARLMLRKLYSKEQTEEIRGISCVTGVDMYLLVALNILLDLFMGCTSGGAQVYEGKIAKMLHFRTLDWGMDPLRKVVVQLQFVEKPGGPVVARSITYVGFIGVLTGVRQGLSVSLNFRPNHDNDSSLMSNMRFYGHHILVLLGLRPSISSRLRDMIIPKAGKSKSTNIPLPDLATILRDFPLTKTTAAYIIACDGQRTAVIEKDCVTAKVQTSSSFIVATNHDVAHEKNFDSQELHTHRHPLRGSTGMEDLVAESRDRKACIAKKWRRASRSYRARHPGATNDDMYISKKTLIGWIQDYPITNEETHFATILDPTTGQVAWINRWEYSAVPYDSSGVESP